MLPPFLDTFQPTKMTITLFESLLEENFPMMAPLSVTDPKLKLYSDEYLFKN